jgi:chemotaxis protein MotB
MKGDAMARSNDAAPVIIKRKKIVAGGGHHGGAWKVAYADFVTAMMAFFLMMWLLGATTESQRRGLADYFAPTVPVYRVSGGGDGAFGGNDIASRETVVHSSDENAVTLAQDSDAAQAEAESLAEAQQALLGRGAESALMTEALRHIVTRLSDEGLVIEIFDLPDQPLFVPGTSDPMPVLALLAEVLTQASGMVVNALAIEGHSRAFPVVHANEPAWTLSQSRAATLRGLMTDSGLEPTRVQRLTAHADRRPTDANPMSSRNNRLEVILLRRFGD